MINTLLTRIAGLFDREFLFASFLPALLFWSIVVATLALVTGVQETFNWLDSWSAAQKTVGGASASVFVVVFGYVLAALRSSMLALWSGISDSLLLAGFFRLMEQLQVRRYRSLLEKSQRLPRWEKVFEGFRVEVDRYWTSEGSDITDADFADLQERVQRMTRSESAANVQFLLDRIVTCYRNHNGDGSNLKNLYGEVKARLLTLQAEEAQETQDLTSHLDRTFGSLATVRATRLGNIIESYQQYAFKRYRIESEILWPRLRRVIPAEYLVIVQEPRIVLDFSLAMTTLAVFYGATAILAGPWLWVDFRLWLAVLTGSLCCAVFFYGMSLRVASELGELVRSSFDLFRLDLLEALQRPRPLTFQEERTRWEEVSRLAVYGDDTDFVLRPK